MKIPSSIKAISALALISALAANLALAGNPNPSGKVPRVCPPGSKAYGKTLTDWLGIYLRWGYGTGQDMAQSQVDGVQLMPLPRRSSRLVVPGHRKTRVFWWGNWRLPFPRELPLCFRSSRGSGNDTKSGLQYRTTRRYPTRSR